ncbi:MAG: mechanosensitive ion channel family protein [Elusimicrobia bacterium]|nr:mechanosensitive ion channel family protein [Elusimicrobiota bacterium]
MEKIGVFLNSSFLGDTVANYVYAAIIFVISLLAIYGLRNLVFVKLRELALKTKTDLDDFIIDLISKIKAPEYQLIALYLATRHIYKSPLFNKALHLIILVVFTYRAIILIHYLIAFWLKKIAAQRQLEESSKTTVINSVKVILNSIIWIAAAIFVLDNLGVNVSALMAGLGIGGVAIALASQTILGDLFNFFVILFDRPFAIGDFIETDSGATLGTIEHIGIKSTRIRSLSGELLIVSNSKLLSDKIRNYNHMQKRRAVFKLQVIHQTPLEKLRMIPQIARTVISSMEKVSFDRANLYNLGDYSIDFEIVYYISDPDYNLYMNIQERIYHGIIEEFAKHKIEFAYPTQTLFVHKQNE